MTISRRLALAALALGGPAASLAQGYPARPIRFIVPFAAGGTTDVTARFIGQHITERTKQPVIVENKVGANGFIGLQHALSQTADGYTVVITSNTTHAANPSLFKKLPYDPIADFVPISGICIGGVIMAVAPGFKAESVKDVVALARQNPGKLTFASGNSSSRMGGELFKSLARIDLLHVPYKSLPAAMTDVIGGQVDMVFGDAPAILPLVRAGKLRALGVSTQTRTPGFEQVPTLAEQGLAGYELYAWLASFAPRGTPADTADKLNALLTSILKTPEAAKFFGETAFSPMATTRQELADFQKVEIARWAQLVKSSGFEPE